MSFHKIEKYHFWLSTEIRNSADLSRETMQTILESLTDNVEILDLDEFEFNTNKPGTSIVFSSHDISFRRFLIRLAEWIYDDNDDLDRPVNSKLRFLFVSMGKPDPAFWAVARLFEHTRIGKVVSISSLFSEICFSLPRNSVTRSVLKRELELHSFPGGVSEIVEICSMDKDCLHTLIRFFRKNRSSNPSHHEVGMDSSIRSLYGAWCSKEINDENFRRAINLLAQPFDEVKRDELQKMIGAIFEKQNQDDLTESLETLLKNKQSASLSSFINGSTILFVEDQLSEDGWNISIPYLFGSNSKIDISEDLVSFQISNPDGTYFTLIHFNTPRNALKWLQHPENKNAINKIDLVLLDLYSSQQSQSGHFLSHTGGISHSIWRLVNVLRKDDLDPRRTQTGPGIVAFTAEDEPMSIYVFSTELGIENFFFKRAVAEGHKRTYFSNFKNAIISSLSKAICNHLSIPSQQRNNKFNRWLLQFDWEDRPLLLHLMQHFNYFSAMDIVNILSDYFDEQFSIDNGGIDPEGEIWISSLGRPNKSGPATLSLFGKSTWVTESAKKPFFLSIPALQERLLHSAMGPKHGFPNCDELRCRENKDWSPENSNNVCIVLIDDVIGTQGQWKQYFSKVVNFQKNSNGKNVSINLEPILSAKRFQFHVVFALGVGTHYELPFKHVDKESGISVKMHVSFPVKSLHNFITENGISQENVIKMLRKYRHITETRMGEFPCQFEPAGWKGEGKNEPDLVDGNGGLFTTYANTPGNTLPIIWGAGKKRQPLFQRFYSQFVSERPKKDYKKNMLCRNKPECKCKLYPMNEVCSARQELIEG